MKMRILASLFAVSLTATASAFALPQQTQQDSLLTAGAERAVNPPVAENGSDRTPGFRVAEDGSDRTPGFRVA
ncbi:hypothetical protein [Metapseudomonas otitidis]|nr:hypothetical protein [Pseudomonas otitidis]MDH1105344.1 hypothetical protein [Pseudomonas otitidis]